MKKIFKAFAIAAAIIASSFTSQSASAQTPRDSKGDVYAEMVTPCYQRLERAGRRYYIAMTTGGSTAEIINCLSSLNIAEANYFWAVWTYGNAWDRDKIIAEESRNGSNYSSTDGGSGSYAARRVGEDAHNARMQHARNTRPTPANTPYLRSPRIEGLVMRKDKHGVSRYYLNGIKPDQVGYRDENSMTLPSQKELQNGGKA